jgi:hypothetical protein
LSDQHNLLGHPKVGASWEGFALEQILHAVRPAEPYFWATHGGAELDLFFIYRGRRYGVEIKFNEAPKVTPSMRTVLETLKLDRLWVVYPGQHSYSVDEKIMMIPLHSLVELSESI